MSAIAGLVSLEGAPVERPRVERMARAAEWLGQDGWSAWNGGPCGVTHIKLVSTPEAVGENQPLIDTEAQLVLVFDGRLDNRAEIISEINAQGRPQNTSDADLVLALFKRFGTRCPERIAGDFAFAVWNIRERQLFCARSLLGWRPFLWWSDGRTFGFATEAKQLFAGGGIDREVNEAMVGEVFAHKMRHAEETLWKGVFRLRPGGALTAGPGGLRQWRWHQPPSQQLRLASEEEYAERFRELFDQAIKACVRSTTPVTAQLSGGLDSSSIVCRAADLFRQGQIASPVQPISAVFPGQRHDESTWIDMVGTKAGINPIRFEPTPYNWDRAIAWTRDTLNIPLRPNAHLMDSSATVAAQHGSRVLLTGEGGDDWLNGSYTHWPELVRQGRLAQLLREGAAARGTRGLVPFLRFLGGNSIGPWISPRIRHLAIYNMTLDGDLPSWIRPEWAKQIGLQDRLRQGTEIPGLSIAQQHRYQRYLGISHTTSYDPALSSMARNGIEIRHPFHDRRLTEFVLGLPGHLLRNGEQRKYILRQAMKGVLPEPIRMRTTKATFVDTLLIAIKEFIATKPMKQWSCVTRGWADPEGFEKVLRQYEGVKASEPLPPGFLPTPLGPLWFALSIDIWTTHAFRSDFLP